MTDLRFAVLGPLRAWRGTTELALGPRRQQLMLALLLIRSDRPVPIGDLAELLWDGEPPPSAPIVLSRYAGNLRRSIGPDVTPRSTGHLLTTTAAGYEFRSSGAQLDTVDFRMATERARTLPSTNPDAKLSAYLTALGTWRGPVAAGLSTLSTLHPAFVRLEQEFAAVTRDAAELARSLGRYELVLPALQAAAERNPADEAVQAHLVLALASTGRRAAAIDHFHHVRRDLARQFGIGPGSKLHAAYKEVISRRSGPARESAVSDRPSNRPAQSPAGLPAAPHVLVGRHQLVSDAREFVADSGTSPAVIAIDGLPGSGKSAFALHIARQLAGRYPDGQLFVDLDDLAGEPLTAVLAAFCSALGAPREQLPTTIDGLAALYRQLIGDRRILILVCHAEDPDQIEPLVPAAGQSLLIVASRVRLTMLQTRYGARRFTLGPLGYDEAHELLAQRIDRTRLAAEPGAVRQIIELCGGLPAALWPMAERISRFPRSTLATFAAEPASPWEGRLYARFSRSYRLLGPEPATLFRRLGGLDSDTLTEGDAARLTGTPPYEARELLTQIARTGLLVEHSPGIYLLHALPRRFAAALDKEIAGGRTRLVAS